MKRCVRCGLLVTPDNEQKINLHLNCPITDKRTREILREVIFSEKYDEQQMFGIYLSANSWMPMIKIREIGDDDE